MNIVDLDRTKSVVVAGRRVAPRNLKVGSWQPRRGLATPAEPYDVVVIGGGMFWPSTGVVQAIECQIFRSGRLRGCHQGRSAWTEGELEVLAIDIDT